MSRDLEKGQLYEAVKTLVDLKDKHLLLNQQKLFTLFSIAFQYLLFRSTKIPGSYIIRVEDSQLVDKLAKRSKDQSTRKFIQSLLLPRKMKFGQSTFYLDFFHLGSWNKTKEIPAERLKGAIIVKNTSNRPMNEAGIVLTEEEKEMGLLDLSSLPEHFYLTGLLESCPKNIIVAYNFEHEGLKKVQFPFILPEKERPVRGVHISSDVEIDDSDD